MRQLVIPVFIPEVGCPGRCVFCDQRRISGQHQVPPPPVVGEIIESHLATCSGAVTCQAEVAFFGGTFTSLPLSLQDAYLGQVAPYMERGLVKRIRISTRPDRIEKRTLERLKKQGVWLIELGIQSLDDVVLTRVGRGYNRHQVMEAITMIRSLRLEFGVQLMPGLPGSSPASDRESAATCAQMRPATARIYPTLVFSGTGLETMWRNGEFTPLSLEAGVELGADLFEIFDRLAIPVIRIGLQPNAELLQPGTVVAGPWHPALGELVRSRVWRRQMDWALPKVEGDHECLLLVHPGQLSQALGQRRTNLDWLRHKYGTKVEIKGSQEVARDEIGVTNCTGVPKMMFSRQEFYQNKAKLLTNNSI